MKKISILFLITSFIFSSCYTELKVKVDVIDRYSIQKSKAYRDLQFQNLYSISNNPNIFRRLKALYFGQAQKIIKEAKSKGITLNALSAETAVTTLSESASNNITNDIKNKFEQLVKDYNTKSDIDVNQQINSIIMDEPEKAFEKLASLLKLQSTPIDRIKFQEIINEESSYTILEAKNILTQYGNSISEDPLASLVAQAPENYWKKFKWDVNIINDDPKTALKSKSNKAKVNNTVVRTFMGNTDIAVKMDAPAYFVVKGVRLDANEAIKSSFKVLNQGIKYMAYAYGIPVNSPAGSNDNSGKIVKIPETNENDSLKLVVNNLGSNDKNAKTAFLNILFSQRRYLDPTTPDLTDSDVKQAVDIIQKAYSIYIKQIEEN